MGQIQILGAIEFGHYHTNLSIKIDKEGGKKNENYSAESVSVLL